MQRVGIEALKGMYKEDEDFKDAFNTCSNFYDSFHNENVDYVLKYGLLFKGAQCIPKFSMRENMIGEKLSKGSWR